MRFLLVHGGWQGGWCWDGVADRLRAAGHDVWAPTLRGLEPGDVDRAGVGLHSMTRDLASSVGERDLGELVAVGHSGGGPVIQGLYELIPDRLSRLVWVSAWVLADGQRIYDLFPREVVDAFTAAAAATPDGTVPMLPEFWRGSLMNDVPPDEADRWLPRVVPCPNGWMSEPASLPTFSGSSVPTSYVYLEDDVAVPRPVYEANAARLRDPLVATSPGAHEAMLTRPAELAAAIMRVSP